jgi:hypothetical protein
MSDSTKGLAGLVLGGVALLLALSMVGLIVFAHGVAYGEDRNRAEAIEANVGRWVIDEKTGDTTFVYGVEK